MSDTEQDPGDSQIIRRARLAGVFVDRLFSPATLFAWAALATVFNLALLAERQEVVTFHPENLEGLTATLESLVEWILSMGSVVVTFLVGVRWLYSKAIEKGQDE